MACSYNSMSVSINSTVQEPPQPTKRARLFVSNAPHFVLLFWCLSCAYRNTLANVRTCLRGTNMERSSRKEMRDRDLAPIKSPKPGMMSWTILALP